MINRYTLDTQSPEGQFWLIWEPVMATYAGWPTPDQSTATNEDIARIDAAVSELWEQCQTNKAGMNARLRQLIRSLALQPDCYVPPVIE